MVSINNNIDSIFNNTSSDIKYYHTKFIILKKVKQIYPLKTIWMYSGFTFEEMFTDGVRANTEWVREILKTIDVLVDGKFVEAKKDISLKFRGSSNQRILDVKQSLDRGEAVIANI